MATRVQIKCINKTNRFDPHDRIHSIGGVNADGSRWKMDQQQGIRDTEAGKWQFFVHADGRSVDVVVAISRYGHKYLKTVPDGEQPDNLLSLPECP